MVHSRDNSLSVSISVDVPLEQLTWEPNERELNEIQVKVAAIMEKGDQIKENQKSAHDGVNSDFAELENLLEEEERFKQVPLYSSAPEGELPEVTREEIQQTLTPIQSPAVLDTVFEAIEIETTNDVDGTQAAANDENQVPFSDSITPKRVFSVSENLKFPGPCTVLAPEESAPALAQDTPEAQDFALNSDLKEDEQVLESNPVSPVFALNSALKEDDESNPVSPVMGMQIANVSSPGFDDLENSNLPGPYPISAEKETISEFKELPRIDDQKAETFESKDLPIVGRKLPIQQQVQKQDEKLVSPADQLAQRALSTSSSLLSKSFGNARSSFDVLVSKEDAQKSETMPFRRKSTTDVRSAQKPAPLERKGSIFGMTKDGKPRRFRPIKFLKKVIKGR